MWQLVIDNKLLKGPDLLNNLVSVLLRFSQKRVAMGADIEAMFHQCVVIKEDQAALTFLWRNLKCEQIPQVYQMLVMIFEAASSPYTVNHILQKTTEDNRHDAMFTPETIKPWKRIFKWMTYWSQSTTTRLPFAFRRTWLLIKMFANTITKTVFICTCSLSKTTFWHLLRRLTLVRNVSHFSIFSTV